MILFNWLLKTSWQHWLFVESKNCQAVTLWTEYYGILNYQRSTYCNMTGKWTQLSKGLIGLYKPQIPQKYTQRKLTTKSSQHISVSQKFWNSMTWWKMKHASQQCQVHQIPRSHLPPHSLVGMGQYPRVHSHSAARFGPFLGLADGPFDYWRESWCWSKSMTGMNMDNAWRITLRSLQPSQVSISTRTFLCPPGVKLSTAQQVVQLYMLKLPRNVQAKAPWTTTKARTA